jgi:hypothetical protein
MEESEIQLSSFTPEQRSEVKSLMVEAMDEYFKNKGTTARHFMVNTAIFIGSLTAIVGGIKIILSWFGISVITR